MGIRGMDLTRIHWLRRGLIPEPAADEYGHAHSSELGDDESRHACGRDARESVGKRSRTRAG